MEVPETRYADAEGAAIAYQVYGSGSVNVVAVPPAASCVERLWDWESAHHYFERWGAFARVAHFDKRGTGYSDRVAGPVPFDQRMDDIRAVMDAAGFDRAAVFGLSEGGPLSMLFAAAHPERASALVLQGTSPQFGGDPEYREIVEQFIDAWVDGWGTESSLTPSMFCPSMLDDAPWLRQLRSYEMASATPSSLRTLMTWNLDIDVRHVLPAITCPTLVLHARGDRVAPIDRGRALAGQIAGAELFEYDSDDHFPCFDAVDEQLDVVERFLTGELRGGPIDRYLATVAFTDVVGSTARAASIGDRGWRTLLDHHDRVVRGLIDDHRGVLVNTTGDGVVATFDAPGRAIACAEQMCEAAASMDLPIRAGVHTGEIERRGADIAGIAVHIGARVAALASAGEVLVSASVPPLVVGSGIEFADRGEHELKGVPGLWRIYAAKSA
jgi:pimeloyl-ACP methyl ester carboxylesterase